MIQRFSKWCLMSGALALTLLHGSAHAATVSLQKSGGTLLRQDFSQPDAWPQLAALASPGVTAKAGLAPVGTVDVADTTAPSGGVLLTAKVVGSKAWGAGIISGLLPVRTGTANLGKLTLSFDLSISTVRPVAIRVESFDAAKRRTGGLSGLIYPAAPDFYQRYALDLSTLKPFGKGAFQPTNPYVQFTVAVHGGPPAPTGATPETEIRLDNVNYATPAYYVSPAGNDGNDGRTEATAFATPQKAMDAAGPGDIVVLMEGTYRAGQTSVASFPRPGLPDAWIVLKNYPGQHPTLTSTGWNIVSIAKGSSSDFSHDPPLAYLEVRGLHIRGEGDVARQKYPDAMNKVDPRTNSNGIAIDSRFTVATFHHIRVADNLIEFVAACGIGGDADWLTVENNICRSNCWTTIYATSGISVIGFANFDAVDNVYKRLIRNNVCCHNQTYEKWADLGRYSDGNGIILDVNQAPDPNGGKNAHPPTRYLGRTLVQSNLCYDNGGSGIHSFRADHVDIINNTVYLNSASVHLEYGGIFAGSAGDVRIMNNIVVAPVADLAAGEKPEPVNGNDDCTNVIFCHNVYFGGNIAPVMGDGDVIADPRFVHPSIKDAQADFHLRPDSPAIGKGIRVSFSPLLGLDGKPRATPPSEGVYEK